MKKRIISLLLALVMVLSLCLISCKKEEEEPSEPTQPAKKVVPVEILTQKPTKDGEEIKIVTKTDVSTVTIPDDAYYLSSYSWSSFVGTVRCYRFATSYNQDANIYVTDYLFYSNVSGLSKKISIIEPETSNVTLADKDVVDYYVQKVSVGSAWSGLIISLEHHDSTYTHILYDAYMNEICKVANSENASVDYSTNYSYFFPDDNYSSFDYIATIEFEGRTFEAKHFSSNNTHLPYTIKETTVTTDGEGDGNEENPDKPVFNPSSVVKDEENGGYYFIRNFSVARFTDDGDIVYAYAFDNIPSDIFDYTLCFLDNQNVLLQYTRIVSDDSENYDFWYEFDCEHSIRLALTTLIYKPADGTLVELQDFNYVLDDDVLTASSDEIKAVGITEGKNYLYEPMIINDYGAVEYLDDTFVSFDDDMNALKHYEYPAISPDYMYYDNGAIVYFDGFTSYFVDEYGNKVADIPYGGYSNYNDLWFIDKKCVYSNTGALIYDFSAANRRIHTVYDKSILFMEDFVDSEGYNETKYVLWSGINSEKEIGTARQYNEGKLMFLGDVGYIVFEDVSGSSLQRACVYSFSGTLLTTVNSLYSFSCYERSIRGLTTYELYFETAVYTETSDGEGNIIAGTNYYDEYVYIYSYLEYVD